jgi:hypothetical protein
MQECRLLTPQDAGMILLSSGGWDTHLPQVSRPNKTRETVKPLCRKKKRRMK